ncbi:hypothetical protein T09_8112 [Trichinella sp. T9]|nr:hypothetical protein T09_8112 [Trichinella sp. T9]
MQISAVAFNLTALILLTFSSTSSSKESKLCTLPGKQCVTL